tara:strand:+ start:372 stop:1028 length:657 start_codon:yes stop_codon:yes gene_type:complete
MGKNLQITKDIEKYISDNSLNLNPIQKEIISYNQSLGEIKKMQISENQCHFLHLLIKTSNVKKILEIGTFTGLSTLSMLLALPDDGKLIALDKNKKTSDVAFNFIKKANQENKIKLIIKPALESINTLKKEDEKFDLIFIDADKENYKKYYDYGVDLIKKNGLIIIDNVLWYGDVVNKSKNDKLTTYIRDFNSYIKKDKKTEKIMMPLGDGLTVCRKL